MRRLIDIIFQTVLAISCLYTVWTEQYSFAAMIMVYLVWLAVKDLKDRPVEITIEKLEFTGKIGPDIVKAVLLLLKHAGYRVVKKKEVTKKK